MSKKLNISFNKLKVYIFKAFQEQEKQNKWVNFIQNNEIMNRLWSVDINLMELIILFCKISAHCKKQFQTAKNTCTLYVTSKVFYYFCL